MIFPIRLLEVYYKNLDRSQGFEGSSIGCGILRLASIATMVTFASFLAIKVFNKDLFDKIASSTKLAEFFFSKKFVLGVAITLGVTLLIAKILSVLMSDIALPDKKNGFAANIAQSVLGIGVAIATITCASLILRNKFSAQNVDLLGKIFLGGFGSAIVIGVLASLITMAVGAFFKKSAEAVNTETNLKNKNTAKKVYKIILIDIIYFSMSCIFSKVFFVILF